MSKRGKHPRIAVIGGGLAGLECALTAARNGCVIEVIETGSQSRMRHVYFDRTKHPGDEKVRSWTSDGWGPGGGLSERLGGRSLCYHGVVIGLDPRALAGWGPEWRSRLSGEDGLYSYLIEELRPSYPELEPGKDRTRLSEFGLRHAPQAARLDEWGRFEAYSPLTAVHSLAAAGHLIVTRGRVAALIDRGGLWDVEMRDGLTVTRRSGFDACVLTSSAICNAQILASSLDRDISTSITDHFCVGAFVRLPPGEPLVPFRHPMLWSGYVEASDLASNLFFLERPHLPGGDRLIEITAVIEQQGSPAELSKMKIERIGEDSLQTHICAHVSAADVDRLDRIRAEVRVWAEVFAHELLRELAPSYATQNAPGSGKHGGTDARLVGRDGALEVVVQSDRSNVFCQFELPYGAFEHEACTHPIGRDNPIPISSDLEVLELPGVFVAGPGAFPRLGFANPALTILATSRWLGTSLAEGKLR